MVAEEQRGANHDDPGKNGANQDQQLGLGVAAKEPFERDAARQVGDVLSKERLSEHEKRDQLSP